MSDGMKKCVHERISKPDHEEADADTDADANVDNDNDADVDNDADNDDHVADDDATSFSSRGYLKCWRHFLPPGDKTEPECNSKKETVLIEMEGLEKSYKGTGLGMLEMEAKKILTTVFKEGLSYRLNLKALDSLLPIHLGLCNKSASFCKAAIFNNRLRCKVDGGCGSIYLGGQNGGEGGKK